jgi:hypothetical protein
MATKMRVITMCTKGYRVANKAATRYAAALTRRKLVEAAAGAVAGAVVEVAVLEAFAGAFSHVGGFFVAAAFFAGGEGAGFRARDFFVSGHAFEEELCGGDGYFDWRARVDLEG